MAARQSRPSPANRYRVEHTERLRRSFHALTGRNLIDPALAPEAAADALFHAPFVVLLCQITGKHLIFKVLSISPILCKF